MSQTRLGARRCGQLQPDLLCQVLPSSPLIRQTQNPGSHSSPPILPLPLQEAPSRMGSTSPSAFPLYSAPLSSSRLADPTAARPLPTPPLCIHVSTLLRDHHTDSKRAFEFQAETRRPASLQRFTLPDTSLPVLCKGLHIDPPLWPRDPEHLFVFDLPADQTETRGSPGLSSPRTELRIHTGKGRKETSTPLQHHLLQQAPKATGTIQAAWCPPPPFLAALSSSPAHRMQCLMPLPSRKRENATSAMTSCPSHTAQTPSALDHGRLRPPPSGWVEGNSAPLG